jgi:cobalt-zinc-cadmium efflux system outer membrane protein
MQVLSMMKSVAVCVAASLVLAGCTRFEAKPLSPERTAAQFEARTLDDPNLKAFLEANLRPGPTVWPLQEWDFDVLTLVALYYHPSLDVARAQWAVARAGVLTAGERPNPVLNFAPQYASNPESGISPWVAPVGIDATVETAGKRGYRVAQAKHTSESARLNLASQAWQVRSHLRASLLDYTAARQRVVLLQEALDARQQNLKLLEGRLAAGAVAATELTTARVAAIQAQADLAEAQRQVAESHANVAQALGVPARAIEGRELKFDLSGSAEAGLESPQARRRALHSRADILAALADYAASQSALQLEIAKQYPDIHLGPGYEYDQGTHKWGLALGAELPVLNRNQGPIAEAQARRDEAAARFLALQAEVIAQIDRSLAARNASQRQLRQIDGLVAAQRRHVQSLEAMIRAGGADQLELSSARLELCLAELSRLDALVKAQQSLGQLEEALQVPFGALSCVEHNDQSPVVKEKKP